MCLEILINFEVNNDIGYKLYIKPGIDRQNGDGYRLFEGHVCHLNKWYEAAGDIVPTLNGKYRTGFHIFPSFERLKQAVWHLNNLCFSTQNMCVVKVKYKNIVARGMQWGVEVVVAQHMQLLEHSFDCDYSTLLGQTTFIRKEPVCA